MTQKRKIGLLIIVFVALICIYMWVRAWNQSEQAQANTMIRITDTEGDKIKKIALNIENGELNLSITYENVTFIKGLMPFYEADCCFSKNSSYKNLSDRL